MYNIVSWLQKAFFYGEDLDLSAIATACNDFAVLFQHSRNSESIPDAICKPGFSTADYLETGFNPREWMRHYDFAGISINVQDVGLCKLLQAINGLIFFDFEFTRYVERSWSARVINEKMVYEQPDSIQIFEILILPNKTHIHCPNIRKVKYIVQKNQMDSYLNK